MLHPYCTTDYEWIQNLALSFIVLRRRVLGILLGRGWRREMPGFTLPSDSQGNEFPFSAQGWAFLSLLYIPFLKTGYGPVKGTASHHSLQPLRICRTALMSSCQGWEGSGWWVGMSPAHSSMVGGVITEPRMGGVQLRLQLRMLPGNSPHCRQHLLQKECS